MISGDEWDRDTGRTPQTLTNRGSARAQGLLPGLDERRVRLQKS